MNINHLSLSWGVSRGRDTDGYTICRLDDRTNGKRYRCMGGGYDMIGTVFGDWLEDVYQAELKRIAWRAHYQGSDASSHEEALYGMRNTGERVSLDGACGIDCMIRIAEAIGLEVEREYQRTGRNRGATLGWYVSPKQEAS